jgi:hypothetical protein
VHSSLHGGPMRAVLLTGRTAGRPGVHHQECMARDSWLSSITWEGWEHDKREHVAKLMARK